MIKMIFMLKPAGDSSINIVRLYLKIKIKIIREKKYKKASKALMTMREDRYIGGQA